MKLVDIGANLTHAAFGADRDQVLSRARQAGVETIVVTGTTPEDSRSAVALADSHPGLFATAGVHPHHARDCGPDTISRLRSACRPTPAWSPSANAAWTSTATTRRIPTRRSGSSRRSELGLELGKPLFLHSRDAHPRFAEILKILAINRARWPIASPASATSCSAYLDLGLYVGITGWICDERRGKHLIELVREIPRDRLLLETDAPYLTPRDLQPQPKARRNEPAFLPHILKAVARALGRPAEEVAAETTRNARTFFALHESGSSAAAQRPLAA